MAAEGSKAATVAATFTVVEGSMAAVVATSMAEEADSMVEGRTAVVLTVEDAGKLLS
jgi:hypothetical protein